MKYLGEYELNPAGAHRESWWATDAGSAIWAVADKLAAFGIKAHSGRPFVNDSLPIDESGQPYMRIVPYGRGIGAIDSVIQDGDLLTYVYGTRCGNSLQASAEAFFKQRGGHAETAYLDTSGKAHQVAVWGNSYSDRLFHDGQTGSNAINIYRLDLSGIGVNAERARGLKHEVVRWKSIFRYHNFPSEMNTDPVDFLTLDDLRQIAIKLVKGERVRDVNCVQWSVTTVSLSLNFPLTRKVVSDLGVADDYERRWAPSLGYADETLAGIGALPVPSYSPARAIQKAFDMYFPGMDLKSMLTKTSAAKEMAALFADNVKRSPKMPAGIGISDIVGYFDKVSSGDLDIPFEFGGAKLKFVMPATFILEERASAMNKSPNGIKFNYVATALPQDDCKRM